MVRLQLQTPRDTQRQEACSPVAALGAVSPVTSRGRGSLPYHLLSGRGFVFTPVSLTWNGFCLLVPLIWFPKSVRGQRSSIFIFLSLLV